MSVNIINNGEVSLIKSVTSGVNKHGYVVCTIECNTRTLSFSGYGINKNSGYVEFFITDTSKNTVDTAIVKIPIIQDICIILEHIDKDVITLVIVPVDFLDYKDCNLTGDYK